MRDASTLLESVNRVLAAYSSALVAFSGGVDSTLVAALAHRRFGDRMLAVFSVSPFVSRGARENAYAVADELGLPFVTVEHPGFVGTSPALLENPRDRCYLCKRGLFELLGDIARERELDVVMHGENADDAGSHRPGAKATAELGAFAPLAEADMTKAEIRLLARDLGLPNADLASDSCLATRFDYDVDLDAASLALVDGAESMLANLLDAPGPLRVRTSGCSARVELSPQKLAQSEGFITQIEQGLRELGFEEVGIDPKGYRSGSFDLL